MKHTLEFNTLNKENYLSDVCIIFPLVTQTFQFHFELSSELISRILIHIIIVHQRMKYCGLRPCECIGQFNLQKL